MSKGIGQTPVRITINGLGNALRFLEFLSRSESLVPARKIKVSVKIGSNDVEIDYWIKEANENSTS